MTADWSHLPYDLLARISTRIINEVQGRQPRGLRHQPQAAGDDRVGIGRRRRRSCRSRMASPLAFVPLLYICTSISWASNTSIRSHDLTKKHGQREVLKNIWLSFYPGAKIGVLGTQRLGQEHAAADHGRHGQGVRRRGRADRRLHRRLPAAGAAAQPRQGRVRQRRGSGRADAHDPATASTRSTPGSASRLEPDEMEKLLRRAGQGAGPDRRCTTPGNSTGRSKSPWTR